MLCRGAQLRPLRLEEGACAALLSLPSKPLAFLFLLCFPLTCHLLPELYSASKMHCLSSRLFQFPWIISIKTLGISSARESSFFPPSLFSSRNQQSTQKCSSLAKTMAFSMVSGLERASSVALDIPWQWRLPFHKCNELDGWALHGCSKNCCCLAKVECSTQRSGWLGSPRVYLENFWAEQAFPDNLEQNCCGTHTQLRSGWN